MSSPHFAYGRRASSLLVSNLQGQSPWTFRNGRRLEAFDVVPWICVNNAETKYHLTVGGMGVAQFSEYIVADALREGSLVRVLEGCHAAAPLVQYAIFQPDRHRLPRVAAMLQFLVETFAPRPWRRQRTSGARREAVAA